MFKQLCRWSDRGALEEIGDRIPLEDNSVSPDESNREFYKLLFYSGSSWRESIPHDKTAEAYGIENPEYGKNFRFVGSISHDSKKTVHGLVEDMKKLQKQRDLRHEDFKGKLHLVSVCSMHCEGCMEGISKMNVKSVSRKPEAMEQYHTQRHLEEAINLITKKSCSKDDLYKALEHAFFAGEHYAIAEKWDLLQAVNSSFKTQQAQKNNIHPKKSNKGLSNLPDWQNLAVKLMKLEPDSSRDAILSELSGKGNHPAKLKQQQNGKYQIIGSQKRLSESHIKRILSNLKKQCIPPTV